MQYFKFPMEYLRVTQGELDSYSHAGSFAMDFGGKDTGADRLYCPCDMVVKRVRKGANGELYLESTLPVKFADGTADYARLLCMHDGEFNVYAGQVLPQGYYFYDEGGMGAGNPKKFANHVHIETGKGKWKSTTQSKNKHGSYVIENQSHLYDLFVLGDDVIILDGGGYNWRTVSDMEKIEKPDDRPKLKGYDVSRYQGDIDWEQVKENGVDFVFLKTVSTNKSFGGIYIDQYFEKNYTECKRLGIPVGVYYYTYAQDKATADRELAKLKEALTGKSFEYPIVVDVEDNLLKPLSADRLTDLVIYALETIAGWGCYRMPYTYLYYSNTELNMDRLAEWDLWLAAYLDTEPAKPEHTIWQYTSKGSVPGISGNVDMNICYVDYAALIREKGLNDLTEKPEESPQPEENKKPDTAFITKFVRALIKFIKEYFGV